MLTLSWGTGDVYAQKHVDVSGTAFLDYYYNLSSVDDTAEDLNGFTYRRLYLTTDFKLSDAFAARARLEATNSSLQPFVKDLYLRWTSDAGHRLFFGITPSPVFDLTEEIWLFRSLEKTILDLNDVVDSRDFGVRADGPLLWNGRVRYALMLGNNNAHRPEDDRYKRVYGRLDVRPDRFIFSLGADYAGYDDQRTAATRVSGVAGYVGDHLQAGVEAFMSQTDMEFGDDEQLSGASLFASAWFGKRWGVVGRFDRVLNTSSSIEDHNLFIAGIVFQPHEAIRFIPNVYMTKADDVDEANLTGRMTLELQL